MGDLKIRSVLEHVTGFAATMRRMGEHVRRSAKLHYRYQQESVFLQATELYVKAVTDLARDLDSDPLRSEGMTGFRDYLTGYVASGPFRALVRETDQVRAGLSGVRYCLRMDGNRITVARYVGEADYSAEVAQAFDRFAPVASAAEVRPPASSSDMNHVETGVVTLVARWFPEEFAALHGFCERYVDLLDPTIGRFDREVQFYLAYLGFIAPLRAVGLLFCYPRVDGPRQESLVQQSFDLALAASLVEEDLHRLSGKLEDDLTRIKTILDEATGDSLVVMNEIFTSTTVADAIYLGSQVPARLIERGPLGVCVTFVDELSRLDEATVTGYVLRRRNGPEPSWLCRLFASVNTAHTLTFAERDIAGFNALSDLRAAALSRVSHVLAQSTEHVLSVFTMLRGELAFYLGCANLHHRLAGLGAPTCYPVPTLAG
jgi:hypothetical protein